MMQTVKECLQTADRDSVLETLVYEFLSDPLALLEMEEHTIREVKEKYRAYMSRFIDTLLKTEADPCESRIVFLADSMLSGKRDREVLMCDVNEVMADENAPYYDLAFTKWSKILGYLVADNRLTRDHRLELLAILLKEMSWMGTDESEHEKKREEIAERPDASLKEIEEGRVSTLDQVFGRLAEKYDFPIDEKDPVQDDLSVKVIQAQVEFTEYSRKRERDRLIKAWREEKGV